MNILMLSATFPYPPTVGGTQVRTFNLLKHLSHNHDVTLVTQVNDQVTADEQEGLRQWVKKLVLFPRPQPAAANTLGGKLGRFAGFLTGGVPPSVLSIASPAMQQWIDDAVDSGGYDVITCEHCVNEVFVRPEWRQQLRTLVNIHSSVYGTCKNQLETGTSENPLRDRLNLPLLRRYEQRYCAKFSRIVVTTDDDRQQIQAFNPAAQIEVIPNGVDFAQFPIRQADPGGYRLMFIGAMDNVANIDAACFFSRDVLPLIQARYPETTLELVGARPDPAVVALGDRPGITVTGRVPSMVDYLHQATVCVVPMRTGFGIKNKTLEAMAAGTPVVGSDRALEGLAVDGPDVELGALRANRPQEYVSAISRLFEDGAMRSQLSANGRSLVERSFTWERAGACYEQMLAP